MSNMYINHFSVYGDDSVTDFHELVIKNFCDNKLLNQDDPCHFGRIQLRDAFFPNLIDIPSWDEIDCKYAYVDDRLKPGKSLCIVSVGGVPFKLHDLYLSMLVHIDPNVVLQLYTYTGHQNEEWARYIGMINGVITEIHPWECV